MISEKTKVSVIVPVYNVKPFLEEALNSVVNQTYQEMEIILVDDGSTDGSSEICDEYAKRDNRIRLIRQSNQGLSAARNAGLNIMTGEFVAFLDSDDAYHPMFVELMAQAMKGREADVVLCKRTLHHTDGVMKHKERGAIDPTITAGLYGRRSTLRFLAEGAINAGVWNKMYRQEIWNNIRFPVGHVYEDTDTTFRVLDACRRMFVIDQPLYMYRKRKGSITGTPSKDNICDWIRSREHFIAFVEKNTPDIFLEAHKREVQKAQFNGMVSMYGRFSGNKQENSRFKTLLRKKILNIGSQVIIGETDIRTRLLYCLMRYCPATIKVLYHTAYPLGEIVRRVKE
ncbi:MAG: glycosyltransferase [Lachnospiraceae bacterium]|nr:glycosyltransferase [Lachnospiraceae bacterium]